jgi:hypothetical protein
VARFSVLIYCPFDGPDGLVPEAPPPPEKPLPVTTWIDCAVRLPSELDVPLTITRVPALKLLADTGVTVDFMMGVELE